MVAPIPPGGAGRPDFLRLIALPAVLTVLEVLVVAVAALAGDVDLLETGLFWILLMWGGVALYLAGTWFDAYLKPRAA